MYLVNTNKIIKYKTIYVLKVMKESNINPCEETSHLVVHRKQRKKSDAKLRKRILDPFTNE